MTEETVTKAAIRGLTTLGWRVLAFDYPQSGSTFRLKRVGSSANTVIPDIVAAKGDTVIIAEAKVHLDRSDHQKLIALRDEWGLYAESLDVVLPPRRNGLRSIRTMLRLWACDSEHEGIRLSTRLPYVCD